MEECLCPGVGCSGGMGPLGVLLLNENKLVKKRNSEALHEVCSYCDCSMLPCGSVQEVDHTRLVLLIRVLSWYIVPLSA